MEKSRGESHTVKVSRWSPQTDTNMNFEQDLSVFFWFVLQLFIQCFHISSLKITICTSGPISLVEVHFCGDQNWHFWRKSDRLQLFLWRPKPDLFLHVKSDHLQFCGTKTSFFPGKLDQLQMFLWQPNFIFLHRKSVYLQLCLWRPKLAFFTACPTNSSCFCGNQICLF